MSLYSPKQEEFACKLMLNDSSIPESNAMEHSVPFRRIMTLLENCMFSIPCIPVLQSDI